MKSEAKTVTEYIEALPEDRSHALSIVRATILENLDGGFQERMNGSMISYEVPLATYPDTYNGKPLLYAAIASQKNHMALYLNCIYSDSGAALAFKEKYVASGKRYDVGKSCVRFRRLDDLPLELVAEYIASHTAVSWISLCDEIFKRTRGKKR
jgi:hypothetical protein